MSDKEKSNIINFNEVTKAKQKEKELKDRKRRIKKIIEYAESLKW